MDEQIEENDAIEVEIDFTPRQWQLDLHQQMKRFNVLVIHRGAGKTILSIVELLLRALSGPPDAEYLFIGPLKNQMMRNCWEPLKRMVSPIPGVYINNNRLEVVLPHKARITILGADQPENLRGMHLHGLVIDEFGDCPSSIWPVLFPMTTNHNAFVLFIGTPKGRNGFYVKYLESQLPENEKDWFGIVLTNEQTKALDPEQIEIAKRTLSPDYYRQEYECDWTASNIGAYYSSQITELRSNGNIIYDRRLHNPELETHVCFDIGMRDFTAVWWFQLVRDHQTKEDIIHWIDFEQMQNLGLPDWNDVLIHRERTLGYRRGSIIFPHDLKVREWGANVSRIEAAERLGIMPELCPDHGIDDRIEMMRLHLPKCKFDGRTCEEGIECLAQYREKLNKNGIGLGLPDKSNGVDHAADSAGYGMLYVKQVMCQPIITRLPFLRRQ